VLDRAVRVGRTSRVGGLDGPWQPDPVGAGATLACGAIHAARRPLAQGRGGLMEPQREVLDSPKGWVARHIRRYVDSDGRNGHEWRPGVYTLLLTTRGRRSGQLRRTALIYGRDGDRYLVVGSVGGAARHPAWYLNLVAHPEVEVQVGADRFAARARTATAEEKSRLWPLMTAIWPQYDDYQHKTRRDIPVVILEPA
jgi:deazaflavin-dependent oxidoreductase (nitroreductase family)